MRQILAVDIGGTFVDAITFVPSTGDIHFEKDFTTPDDAAIGVYAAIDRLGLDVGELGTFIHGTTLGLNTVLQRNGAATGIITNAGFEDVFEMGRYMRERAQMYSLVYDVPPLLVPRRLRLGVKGRINAAGEEIVPLDEAGVIEAARTLIEGHGVASIAVCYLHGYRNPVHETRSADIIRERWPQVSVSVSSEIVREYREYERTATTVVNAYVKPIFQTYIDGLERALARDGFDGAFFITRSGGGALPAHDAIANPVHTIFSGPAGGIIGATYLARALERPNLIAVDVGGTSTDACVIHGGRPSLSYEARLERLPLMIPTYDIATIGAGGGSIARVEGTLLKVGPQSAGARPGPICYGRGGTEPTMSDAALTLGYLSSTGFLGGEMALHEEAARAGIENRIARPLGLTLVDAARGIFDVLIAKSVAAIRVITVERGLDPRDFAMLVYGGAGPMFATAVAREMGAREVIVPQAPSVFSAWGMLMADVVQSYTQTMVGLINDVGLEAIRTEAARLAAIARKELEWAQFAPGDQMIEAAVELRYFGQEHALEIPIGDDDDLDRIRRRFDDRHRARYGHAMADPVQIVNLRVQGIGRNNKPAMRPIAASTGAPEPRGLRPAFCLAERRLADFRVYARGDLRAGDQVPGPAIIEERTTTIVLHSDQSAHVDRFGIISIRGSEV